MIKILFKNPEWCIINDGKTTAHFLLERRSRQGDAILVYLFILALEVIFALINASPNIEGLQLLSHNFLYSAYADATAFFLGIKKTALELINTFDTFSHSSGLKNR